MIASDLPGILVGVQGLHAGQAVAIRRVAGAGGAFYQGMDIAVLPAHQDRGPGKVACRLLNPRHPHAATARCGVTFGHPEVSPDA